jgi:hypothetical protein
MFRIIAHIVLRLGNSLCTDDSRTRLVQESKVVGMMLSLRTPGRNRVECRADKKGLQM